MFFSATGIQNLAMLDLCFSSICGYLVLEKIEVTGNKNTQKFTTHKCHCKFTIKAELQVNACNIIYKFGNKMVNQNKHWVGHKNWNGRRKLKKNLKEGSNESIGHCCFFLIDTTFVNNKKRENLS